MQVGITVDPVNPAAQAVFAERWGFDFVGSGEHVFFHGPMPNAFIALAAAAGATERIRLLSALTLLPLYPPALAAKMVASLDVVSAGRFELGVGIGGEYPPEFQAVGVPVRERGRRTDEALALITGLLTGGAYPGIEPPLVLDPPPVQRPRPPFIIGGRTAAAQRRAGRFGDEWMPYLVTPEQLAAGLAVANRAASEYGRGPIGGAAFLWMSIDEDGPTARRTAIERVGATYQQDFTALADRYLVAGTPDQVIARIREYGQAGAERVLLTPASQPGPEARRRTLALIADHVVPALAEGRSRAILE